VDTSFIHQQAPFSGTVAGEQASLHRFSSNFVLDFVYHLLLKSNPYYLENHFVLFCFVFVVYFVV
jgi:hypothetical protein